MEKDFVLTDRKKELLLSSVENYIENALPITSEKVQKNNFNSLSSATLRNELNALEEMGFLKQLHTSSGRVPTTKAYRYFVNSVIENKVFDPKAIENVESKFIKRSSFLMDVLDDLAKKINEILDLPTFVHLKGYNELIIQGINIIPLITGEALCLLQTNAGIINNTIKLSGDINEENCRDASKFLTNNLANKKISEVLSNYEYYNNLFKTQIRYFEELFLSLTEMMKNFSEQTIVKRGNTTKMLNAPEYRDLNQAKKFLTVVENENKIKDIIQNIDDNSNSDVVFSIGDENNSEDLNDYSIIKANYSLANGIVASVGVVGPERMDYAKIASVLKYITDEVKNEQQLKIANSTDKAESKNKKDSLVKVSKNSNKNNKQVYVEENDKLRKSNQNNKIATKSNSNRKIKDDIKSQGSENEKIRKRTKTI